MRMMVRGPHDPKSDPKNFTYAVVVYFFLCAVVVSKIVLVVFVQVPDIIGGLSPHIKDEVILYLTREVQESFGGVVATVFGVILGGVYFMRVAWLANSKERPDS